LQVPLACVEVVDLEDRHVPGDRVGGVAAALREQAVNGRLLRWADARVGRDDLEELVADRHQRVVQSERGHPRITEADAQAEVGAQRVDDPIELVSGEGDLAESDHARMLSHAPLVRGGVRVARLCSAPC
jgi:hypothetical protein